jgi:dienelactone hydrolase
MAARPARRITMIFPIASLGALFALGLVQSARGKIATRAVVYMDGDTALEGFLAHDEALQSPLPAVLIVHKWNGLEDYIRRRTVEVAKLGYAAFPLDIYGRGVRPKTREESARESAVFTGNRPLMRRRALAGLTQVRSFPFVDPRRVAAMGYCFGGGVVLEMARAGADLLGVVSFHGTLDTPRPEATPSMIPKILVLHGADDPFTSQAQLATFESEMRRAKADWEVNIYGNAVHGFTDPASGSNPSLGVAYSQEADQRSWRAMKDFFAEIFRR